MEYLTPQKADAELEVLVFNLFEKQLYRKYGEIPMEKGGFFMEDEEIVGSKESIKDMMMGSLILSEMTGESTHMGRMMVYCFFMDFIEPKNPFDIADDDVPF